MRLDHVVLAHLRRRRGHCTLKEAQRAIERGEFAVDGALVTVPKYQILPGVERVSAARKRDEDASSGEGEEEVTHAPQPFYMLHKPRDVLCQRHPSERSVYDLVPARWARADLGAFGRLDADTTGLLLFGTDGGVQSLLTFPTSRVWKVYLAELTDGSALASDAAERFAAGIDLGGGVTCAPASLEVIGRTATAHRAGEASGEADGAARGVGGAPLVVRVRVHEGMFHQAGLDSRARSQLAPLVPHEPTRGLSDTPPPMLSQVKRMISAVGGTVARLHRERCAVGPPRPAIQSSGFICHR